LQSSEANLLLGKSNVTKKYANEKTHKCVGLNSGSSHIGYISHFVLGLWVVFFRYATCITLYYTNHILVVTSSLYFCDYL